MRCFCACRFCFSAERVFATMLHTKLKKCPPRKSDPDSTRDRGCQRGGREISTGAQVFTTVSEPLYAESGLSPMLPRGSRLAEPARGSGAFPVRALRHFLLSAPRKDFFSSTEAESTTCPTGALEMWARSGGCVNRPPFALLGLIPEGIHLGQRGIGAATPALCEPALDMVETRFESPQRPRSASSGCAFTTAEIGHRKQQSPISCSTRRASRHPSLRPIRRALRRTLPSTDFASGQSKPTAPGFLRQPLRRTRAGNDAGTPPSRRSRRSAPSCVRSSALIRSSCGPLRPNPRGDDEHMWVATDELSEITSHTWRSRTSLPRARSGPGKTTWKADRQFLLGARRLRFDGLDQLVAPLRAVGCQRAQRLLAVPGHRWIAQPIHMSSSRRTASRFGHGAAYHIHAPDFRTDSLLCRAPPV